MKLIVLLVGAALGFGGGVWWGVHNPTQAASLSAQEEAEFIKTAQAAKDKLDAMAARQLSTAGGGASIPIPGSSFAGGSTPSASPVVDPELQKLSQQMAQQLDAMKAKVHK